MPVDPMPPHLLQVLTAALYVVNVNLVPNGAMQVYLLQSVAQGKLFILGQAKVQCSSRVMMQ
jgi:hypothetical protein